MRTAIVGANLLGCATAFYLRRALNANVRDTAGHSSPDECDEDEIVIFDQKSRPGGQKFCALSFKDGSCITSCGTASGLDVSSAPVFLALLRDANIPVPPVKNSEEWAIFDWDADAYHLSRVHSRLLSGIQSFPLVLILLQLFSLFSLYVFAPRLYSRGIYTFIHFAIEDGTLFPFIQYGHLLWFCFALILGFGIIPVPVILRFYDYIAFRSTVRLLSSIHYGAPILSTIRKLTMSIKNHLELIVAHNAASSCVTLGHLLSACGISKYVKQSTIEMLVPMHIREPFLTQCVSVPMALAHGDSTVTPTEASNVLSTLLTIMSFSPVPASLRSSPRYMSVLSEESLCPTLIESSRAKFRPNVRVVAVTKAENAQYKLQGVVNGEKTDLGIFDAVLLAGVIDPNDFTTDALDEDISVVFSLPSSEKGTGTDRAMVPNTAQYISLVKGEINPQFFRLSSAKHLAEKTYLVNSINCLEVLRVSDNVWRVTSREFPEKECNLFQNLFNNVDEIVSLQRTPRRYPSAPCRNIHGTSTPDLILNTRFLNVAAIDCICNDVNIDCLAARNAASLFRRGVATWK